MTTTWHSSSASPATAKPPATPEKANWSDPPASPGPQQTKSPNPKTRVRAFPMSRDITWWGNHPSRNPRCIALTDGPLSTGFSELHQQFQWAATTTCHHQMWPLLI